MDYMQKLKDGARNTIDHLTAEYTNIRTGRAHVGLVSDILVDVYGSKTPLKQVANITVSDAKSLTIQPWDKGNLVQIESALRSGDISLSIVNTGEAVHANIPDLTEERRNEYKKLAKEKAEEAKVSVRNSRRDVWEETQTAKANNEISEDDMYRREQELNKFVEEKNKEIDALLSGKEKELSEV
jgi:ribosome recycling factor